MDFLTDARLPSELHDEYDGVPASRWDSVSRQAGIVAGADQWAQRLGRCGENSKATGMGRRVMGGSSGSSTSGSWLGSSPISARGSTLIPVAFPGRSSSST